MNVRDAIIAAAIATAVYALAVRLARRSQPAPEKAYVPQGFEWSHKDGAYIKQGSDGLKYLYV